jgi:hypothetical protein
VTTETALPLRRADRERSPDATPPRSPFTDEGVRPDTRGLLVKSESFLLHGSPPTPATHVEEWLQAHEARWFRGNHAYTVATLTSSGRVGLRLARGLPLPRVCRISSAQMATPRTAIDAEKRGRRRGGVLLS